MLSTCTRGFYWTTGGTMVLLFYPLTQSYFLYDYSYILNLERKSPRNAVSSATPTYISLPDWKIAGTWCSFLLSFPVFTPLNWINGNRDVNFVQLNKVQNFNITNLLGRDYLALNVYVALCYYKLDYYDVAQEVLQVYLQKYPDSAIAINLKACNHFRLYDGNAAQSEMKQLIEKISSSFSFGHDLIRHNTVVCIKFSVPSYLIRLLSSVSPCIGVQRWRKRSANFAKLGGRYTGSQAQFGDILLEARRRQGGLWTYQGPGTRGAAGIHPKRHRQCRHGSRDQFCVYC